MRRQMISNKGADTFSTNTAEVRPIKDQYSEAKVRTFTLVQDDPPSVGGTGKGPTTTDYFIASVGFCENLIFARNASIASLALESPETTVTGNRDRRGLFDIDEVAPSFKTITVETKVKTMDPIQKVVEVANQLTDDVQSTQL
jgi:uncharacterized OsmC-like protein